MGGTLRLHWYEDEEVRWPVCGGYGYAPRADTVEAVTCGHCRRRLGLLIDSGPGAGASNPRAADAARYEDEIKRLRERIRDVADDLAAGERATDFADAAARLREVLGDA